MTYYCSRRTISDTSEDTPKATRYNPTILTSQSRAIVFWRRDCAIFWGIEVFLHLKAVHGFFDGIQLVQHIFNNERQNYDSRKQLFIFSTIALLARFFWAVFAVKEFLFSQKLPSPPPPKNNGPSHCKKNAMVT